MESKVELKVLSKDDQIEIAKDILSKYPKANKIVVASDGQAFISDESDAAAKNHSKSNVYGKELKLEVFMRDELTEKAQKAQKTDKEVIALIDAAETADAVNALTEGDERKSVIDAATKKLETFKAAK